MKIDKFELGLFQTNCYVLTTSESVKECVIIDAGLDAEPMMDYLRQSRLVPEALILTHGHIDHIAGIELLRQEYPNIKIAVHKFDSDMLTDAAANLSAMFGLPFKTEPAEVILQNQSCVTFAGISFYILHTPGHTPGGISLYNDVESIVFSGDALFADGIGRTDFPGGNYETLIKGIKDNLLTLGGKTIVYPGHGPATTIESEKKYNQYLV